MAEKTMLRELTPLYNDLLLAYCPDMIFLFDMAQNLIFCSSASHRILRDIPRSELQGKHFSELFHTDIQSGWLKKLAHRNDQVLECKKPQFFTDTILFVDNRYIHVQSSLAPVLLEDGICMGTMLVMQNITELFDAQAAADEVARSRDTFFLALNHEIRTPMNALKGLSELMCMTELNPLQHNYMQNILSSTNSLISIVNDVLDYTKVDANDLVLTETEYPFADFLQEVLNITGIRAEEKRLMLLVDVPADSPSRLRGDVPCLRQVMLHLLSNAIKYTDEGYIKISIHVQELSGVPHLYFSVTDSGTGLRQSDIPHLFDAYSQFTQYQSGNEPSAGLGLAISKRLVCAMSGEISIDSTYGEGSTFSFHVPQKIVDAAPIASVAMPESKRVLVLANPLRADAISEMLRNLHVDYTTLQAEDISLALQQDMQYTHCIYDDSFVGHPIATIRESLPESCECVALRSMHAAVALAHDGEHVLIDPLYITSLAKFLDSSFASAELPVQTIVMPESFMLRDTRLLVVDDNDISLLVSSEMLRLFGADVMLANSGDEALRICEEECFDIIFLDHMMPGMDGLEVARRLHTAGKKNAQTPLVALTAYVQNANMLSYYIKNGLDDFVAKPFEFEDLARVLLRWLPKENIVL